MRTLIHHGGRTERSRTAGRGYTGEQVKAQVKHICNLLSIPVEVRAVGLATYGEGEKARRVMHGKKGQPDLTGTIPGPGIRLEIEAKAFGELPRPEQMRAILAAQASGSVAFWCDDATMAHLALRLALDGYRLAYTDRTTAVAIGRDDPLPAYTGPVDDLCTRKR